MYLSVNSLKKVINLDEDVRTFANKNNFKIVYHLSVKEFGFKVPIPHMLK